MILEIAKITVKAGNGDEFMRVIPDAFPHIAGSPGYVRHELHRGIEQPDTFTLLVWWEKLEDHTVTFRESERFTAWRGVWGHLLDHAEVLHYSRAY